MTDLSGAVWRKSTRSGDNGGDCVEVATNLSGIVAVRDSKNPEGPTLTFDPAAWGRFVAHARARSDS
ncbi:DUF397 domain-containing protein [Micromonospora musae]|uniref:DUF397 domain-containing protein n=1 Tax=Micromonospora musae TaxID=1894970 RepID=A0A3A9YDS1_9ACTN|nr:DUF397 domain-containing protein [Micromonospora musae]RKN32444.1 DUF397 domain-containing protein [Micromonospora musae]